jgi:hypothetical protein
MQESNAAWMWSEAFVEALERAMLDPPLVPAERQDWPKFCKRLRHWWQDVKEARKEYLEEHPAHLQNLYNFWRNVGREDVREQAMLARHSYPRFRLWGWRIHAAGAITGRADDANRAN